MMEFFENLFNWVNAEKSLDRWCIVVVCALYILNALVPFILKLVDALVYFWSSYEKELFLLERYFDRKYDSPSDKNETKTYKRGDDISVDLKLYLIFDVICGFFLALICALTFYFAGGEMVLGIVFATFVFLYIPRFCYSLLKNK